MHGWFRLAALPLRDEALQVLLSPVSETITFERHNPVQTFCRADKRRLAAGPISSSNS